MKRVSLTDTIMLRLKSHNQNRVKNAEKFLCCVAEAVLTHSRLRCLVWQQEWTPGRCSCHREAAGLQ